MSILETVLTIFLILIGGYLLMRLLSKAFFRSYFETKTEFNEKQKEEKKDAKI